MGNRITGESMELIAGEIMDAVHASDSPENCKKLIRKILEGNGIVEVIQD